MLIELLDICFKTCYYLYIKIFDIEKKHADTLFWNN